MIKLLLSIFLFINVAIAEPYYFNFSNDYFAPGGEDKWLTNSMKLGIGDFAIGSDMYTPKDKRNKELPKGDRPWDGYTYIEYTEKYPIVFGESETFITRFGALGDASEADKMQKWMHNDLGFGADPSWVGQNPSQPAFELIYSKNSHRYLHSYIGDTKVSQSHGFRIGNVADEIFLDQEVRKHFFKNWFVHGGLEGKGIFFNTHLNGRLFESDVYTVDHEWLVASARAGISYNLFGCLITYEYKYQTQEFKGQDGRHLFGSLTFTFNN